jgi:hypothetical protein
MSQVMVAHPVQHVFDQNVIVTMKQMKSNIKKYFILKFIFFMYSVHNEEINIIHIKHQLILMKMLMIHFMMKINGNKKKRFFFN